MRTMLLDLGNTRLKWKLVNELTLSADAPKALVHSDSLDCWQADWHNQWLASVLMRFVRLLAAFEASPRRFAMRFVGCRWLVFLRHSLFAALVIPV